MTNNTDYPLPAHALSIWKVGHDIYVGVPAQGKTRGTTLKLPLDKCGIETSAFGGIRASQRGWAILLDILRAREAAGQRPAYIGTRSAPVQYDVDKMIKEMGGFGGGKPQPGPWPAIGTLASGVKVTHRDRDVKVTKVVKQGKTSLADLGLED